MGIELVPGSSAMISGGDSAGGVSGGVSTGGSAEAGTGAACGASIDVSTTPSSDLILSQSSGGGSTGATSTLSSPSRRSTSAPRGEDGIEREQRSACARSSASSVPSTYSRAAYRRRHHPARSHRHSIASQALPDFQRLRRSQVLIVFAGASNCAAELIPAPAAVIGQQHHAPPVLIELAEAGEQALQLLGHLAPRQRIRRSSPAAVLAAGSSSIERLPALADEIERPVARDRHHPGDRGRQFRVETAGIVPDFQVGLLHHLVGEVASPQDTNSTP